MLSLEATSSGVDSLKSTAEAARSTAELKLKEAAEATVASQKAEEALEAVKAIAASAAAAVVPLREEATAAKAAAEAAGATAAKLAEAAVPTQVAEGDSEEEEAAPAAVEEAAADAEAAEAPEASPPKLSPAQLAEEAEAAATAARQTEATAAEALASAEAEAAAAEADVGPATAAAKAAATVSTLAEEQASKAVAAAEAAEARLEAASTKHEREQKEAEEARERTARAQKAADLATREAREAARLRLKAYKEAQARLLAAQEAFFAAQEALPQHCHIKSPTPRFGRSARASKHLYQQEEAVQQSGGAEARYRDGMLGMQQSGKRNAATSRADTGRRPRKNGYVSHAKAATSRPYGVARSPPHPRFGAPPGSGIGTPDPAAPPRRWTRPSPQPLRSPTKSSGYGSNPKRRARLQNQLQQARSGVTTRGQTRLADAAGPSSAPPPAQASPPPTPSPPKASEILTQDAPPAFRPDLAIKRTQSRADLEKQLRMQQWIAELKLEVERREQEIRDNPGAVLEEEADWDPITLRGIL